jgi:cytochrome c oxidase subunit 2
VIAASPSILDGAGRESHHVAGLWWVMLTMATVVYVVVAALVVIALTRRRSDDGGERTQFIWWGGVLMPIVVLGILAFLTVSTTTALGRDAKEDLTVDVVGHRWWWEVRYPGEDRTTANEVHLPVDRVVDLRLTSVDVIHSFWVPQLAGKLDLIPGQTNHLKVKATRTGTFLGECAEFCGIQHANMRFVVVVQSRADYERWLHHRPGSSEDAGRAVFERESCAGCHTVEGTQADGRVGPDLTDLGARRWLAAKAVRNTPAELAQWITDPDSIKPGVLMPATRLSAADLRDLVAYLESLR